MKCVAHHSWILTIFSYFFLFCYGNSLRLYFYLYIRMNEMYSFKQNQNDLVKSDVLPHKTDFTIEPIDLYNMFLLELHINEHFGQQYPFNLFISSGCLCVYDFSFGCGSFVTLYVFNNSIETIQVFSQWEVIPSFTLVYTFFCFTMIDWNSINCFQHELFESMNFNWILLAVPLTETFFFGEDYNFLNFIWFYNICRNVQIWLWPIWDKIYI